MRWGRFVFAPTLPPTIAVVLLLPVLFGLGVWQWDRARQKEHLLEAFARQAELPFIPLEDVDPGAPDSRYRRVSAAGHFDSEHQILLDNVSHNGQPGYHVFTPLRMTGSDKAILVNRGWVPLGESRQRLPAIATSAVDRAVLGRLSQPANPGLRMGESPSPEQGWPLVVQYLDYAEVATRLGYPLAPAVILLDPAASDGFLREWRPSAPGFGPERNRGYAVQWFALALTLIALYIGVNTRRLEPAVDAKQ